MSRSACLLGSALTNALSSILLSGEECSAEDVGHHLAMSFGPGLITRARCDAYLARTEQGARPMTDRQWAAVHAAIAVRLAEVTKQERIDAYCEGREEQEVADLEDLVTRNAESEAA